MPSSEARAALALRMNVLGEEQRRVRMPNIMHSDPGQLGPLKDLIEVPAPDVVEVEGLAG